jgi:DegV family protein with EDD domain
MSVQIIMDSASDISKERAEENNIMILPVPVQIDGKEYLSGEDLFPTEFYELLKNSNELPKTSQITPIMYEDAFQTACEKGNDIVCITMSSALSGTYNNAVIAAETMMEKYPDRSIYIIDSLQVSVGELIQGVYAGKLAKSGKKSSEIFDDVTKMQKNIRIIALVDTLEYIKKGGRISGAAAAIGGLLSIKPVITIDESGKLKVIGKARGSANGNNLLKTKVKSDGGIDFNYPICLAYSGESDEMLQKYINDSKELYTDMNGSLPIENIGPAIGTYSGPGAIVLAYYNRKS